MSCSQLTVCPLPIIPKYTYSGKSVSRAHVNFSRANVNFPNISLTGIPRARKLRQHGPICVFGYQGNPGNTAEGPPWKDLEKAIGNFKKEPSIEEQLKQQIAKNEFYKEEGNNGGGRGGGGRGGGGRGGGDSGESEDEGIPGIVAEVLQVMFATLGFGFLYIFIIEGEDITRLAGDFIKFVFTGKKSIRLGRLFDEWSMFLHHLTKKPEVEENWLEKAIINTPTLYDGPDKYKRYLESHLGSLSNLFDDVSVRRSNFNDDDQMDSRFEDNDDDM